MRSLFAYPLMRATALALMTLLPVNTLAATPATSPPMVIPLHITAILSLSGSFANAGMQEKTALRVAADAVNQTGGVQGRSIEIDFQDDHSSVDDAHTIASEVVEKDHPVAIIGGSYNATCNAIRSVTAPNHIVQYCLSGLDANGPTFFSSFPEPSRSFGDLPVTWMRLEGYHRVAVITSDDRTGRLYSREIVSASLRQHVAIVIHTHIQTAADIQKAVSDALAVNPDVVYVGTQTQAAQVLAQMKTAQSQIPVWLVSSDATRNAAKSYAENLPTAPVYTAATKLTFFESLPASDPQRQLLSDFTTAYSEIAPGKTPDNFSAIAADAAEFLVAALRADNGIGGLTLAQTIERTPRAPGLYAWYHFNALRHNGTELPGAIVQYRPNGSLQYVMTLQDADIPTSISAK